MSVRESALKLFKEVLNYNYELTGVSYELEPNLRDRIETWVKENEKPEQTLTEGGFENLKNGKKYFIKDITINATNGHEGERMYVYYQVDEPDRLYVRSEVEFNIKFKRV